MKVETQQWKEGVGQDQPDENLYIKLSEGNKTVDIHNEKGLMYKIGMIRPGGGCITRKTNNGKPSETKKKKDQCSCYGLNTHSFMTSRRCESWKRKIECHVVGVGEEIGQYTTMT